MQNDDSEYKDRQDRDDRATYNTAARDLGDNVVNKIRAQHDNLRYGNDGAVSSGAGTASEATNDAGQNVTSASESTDAASGAVDAAEATEGGDAAAASASSAAATGAEAAGSVATGGAEFAIAAALKAAKATANELGSIVENKKSSDVGIGTILFAIVLLVVILFIGMFANVSELVAPVTSQYTAENYSQTYSSDTKKETKNGILDLLGKIFKRNYSDDESDDLPAFNNDESFANATDRNIDITQSGFKKAIKLADDDFKEYLTKENHRRELENVKILAWNAVHDEKNQKDLLQLYDVDKSLSTLDEFPWDKVYGEVNYAEFLSISQENDTLRSTTAKIKNFKKLFANSSNLKKLYRIRMDDMTDSDGTYYLKATIKKYTLQNLYDFYGVDAYAKNTSYKNTQNKDVLDQAENAMRLFMPYYTRFGSSIRTDWSDDFMTMSIEQLIAWEDGQISQYKDGQDAQQTWNQVESILNNGDYTEAQKKIVEEALKTVGSAYNQDHRNQPGVYDCSSLVARVYAAAGYSLASNLPSAAEECRMAESWGTIVSSSKDIQPGDLIFFSYPENGHYNGRYKNVSHVAIYIGNGMQIDARGRKYGVVERTSQASSGAVVSICRPLAKVG